MAFKSWLSCFLVTIAVVGLSDALCPNPTALANGNFTVVYKGLLVVHYCVAGYLFSTNDSAITSSCTGTAWSAVNVNCVAVSTTAGATGQQQCPTVGPSTPNNAVEINATDPASTIMKIYSCTNDMQWLSGEAARISQCNNGNWTIILDICDVGCPIPRHCEDVAALGLTGEGDFYVIPSGQSYGQIYTVHCSLNNTDDGGNWTYIFKTDKTNFVFPQDKYLNGINSTNYTSSPNYFIGLLFLADVSLSLPNDTAGMVLEVLFQAANGTSVAYATYNNFTVGPPSTSYTLTSLGKYHGTAGDGLCPHLSTQFLFNGPTATDALWWGAMVANISTFVNINNGSFLTSSGTWDTLNPALGLLVKTIVMRIRPTAQDNAVLCPPMVGSEYWWTSTNASIPLSRTPGTVITWQCFGDYIEEGQDGGTRTFFGNATCIDGQPPYWDYNVTLPCTLNCPSGFVESGDATVCFNYSTDAASSIMDASNKCSAQGAYLTTINNVCDLDTSDNMTEYYTANVARGANASHLIPPLVTAILDNCSTTCQPNKSSQCTVVQYPDKYEHVSCYSSHNYLCQLQGYCPRRDYFPFGGMCLKLMANVASVSNASAACAADGASLVYPTTVAQANNITNFVAWNDSIALETSPVNYIIGTNHYDGDWTAGGKYVMGDLLTPLNTDPVNFWREMVVTSNKTFTFTPIDIKQPLTGAKAICTLFGYIGCDSYCPAPAGNMMMLNGSINSTDTGATTTYQCYPGYYFNITGNPNVTNSTCNGPIGGKTGWIPSVINDCIPLPVCQNSTLDVQSTLLTNDSVSPTSFYLNSTITFTCPPDMAFHSNGSTEMNTTCITGFMFSPAVIPACNVCLGNVTVNNATTNSSAGTYLTVGSVVVATCVAGYEVGFNLTVQHILCTESGWNMTGIKDCFIACTEMPPNASLTDNVIAQNETVNAVGTILSYNCTPGYSYVVSPNFTAITNTATATCSANGTWVTSRTPLKCDLLCTTDPPIAPENTNSSWDGLNRNKGLQVIYAATSPGMLFGNFSTTWTIVCNGSLWLPIDNSSTSPTGNGALTARKACLLDPPTNIGGALPVNWNTSAKGFITQNITYNCLAGHYTSTGLNSTMITCDSATSNWTTAPANFVCKMACDGPPPAAPTRSSYNYSGDFTEGVVVAYYCIGGFDGGLGSNITNNCTSGNWTMTTIPTCLTVTTPKPTTTPPFIFQIPDSLRYDDTANLHLGDLQNFMPISNKLGDFTLVSSLVGFGYAVGLNASKSQCLVKSPYAPTSASSKCEINPKDCPSGFSVSIWARAYFDADDIDFQNSSPADDQFFLSTGGDIYGTPGVLIGVQKIWLFALVSTGVKYWNVSVLGPLQNSTWNNIGVKWGQQSGLQLFVNGTRVGSTTVSVSTSPKSGFDPSMLMIGCTKSPGSDSYTGFVTADLDEVAIWTETLNETSTKNFMGGFAANNSLMSSLQLSQIIKDALLNDPQQQAAAVSILAQMSLDSPTSAPNGTNATGSVDAFKKFLNLAQTANDMFNLDKVPASVTPKQFESFMNLANPISNLLSPSNKNNWLELQNQTENLGWMQTIINFQKWEEKLVQAIKFSNGTDAYCYENVLDNIYLKTCKMSIEDLQNMARRIQIPDYTQEPLRNLRNAWQDILTDRVNFPTTVFTDSRCNNRSVTFLFHYYDNAFGPVVPIASPVNIDPESIKEIDSRLMYVNMIADPPTDSTGAPDPSQPLCQMDPELVKKQKVIVRAEHTIALPALYTMRKLQLFENVTDSNVIERYGVFWNENLTDFGAWDDRGCTMVDTNDEYSKFACSNFGVVAVLATKTPPRVVPPEPSWLTVPKYILYALSAIAIIMYIVVVMISGDLKDQFHLMGLNLAFAILIGSLAMVFSDLKSVINSRDSCTAFGTLIHLFYGAVGAWMTGLGHSSFKAITAGVIGGRLNSYMLLCWGIAIAFVGIPYIWLFPQMGTDPRCFIGWDNIVKWVFFVLQMTYTLFSVFFAVVIFCNISTPALRKDNLIEDYCSFCRGAALLIFYLSLTWLFGLFAYMRFPFNQVNFYPIFQVLNSLSGVCLFFFIGLGSTRFRSVLAGQAKARHEKLKTFAFGYPQESEKETKKLVLVQKGRNNTASTSNLVSSVETLDSKEE